MGMANRINTASPANLAEQAILDDISYLESQIRELHNTASLEERAMLRVYARQLNQRRQMLAAHRAGRPSAWQEFRPAVL